MERLKEECIEKLKFHKLSAKAWELIGIVPIPLEGTPHKASARKPGRMSVGEVMRRAVYANEAVKIPQSLPKHVLSVADEARRRINDALDDLSRSVESTKLESDPEFHSEIEEEPLQVITTPIPKKSVSNDRRILHSVLAHVSSGDLRKLSEISDACQSFLNGTKVQRVPLGEQSAFVRRVFNGSLVNEQI